ncbi:hypothetical protein CH375_15575, partial [Leptospira ellisii]
REESSSSVLSSKYPISNPVPRLSQTNRFHKEKLIRLSRGLSEIGLDSLFLPNDGRWAFYGEYEFFDPYFISK